MTLHDTASQIIKLAVGGYINGEKFSESRLQTWLGKMLSEPNSKAVFEIALPDGRWFAEAIRDERFGYDYYIPDTREDEARIIAGLGR